MGEENDDEFNLLKDDLINLVKNNIEDVRSGLFHIREKLLKRNQLNEKDYERQGSSNTILSKKESILSLGDSMDESKDEID